MTQVDVSSYIHGHPVTSLINGEELFPQLPYFVYGITGDGVRVVVKFGVRVPLVSTGIRDIETGIVGGEDNPVGHGQVLD